MDFLVQKHIKNASKSYEISQSTPPRLPAYAGNPGGVVWATAPPSTTRGRATLPRVVHDGVVGGGHEEMG